MNKLEYQPGIAGTGSIPLDGPTAFVGTAENLRSREWAYKLGYRDVLSATRPAREVSVLFETDYATADALRRAADADALARTPGLFVAQGEWKQRGYILASEPDYIHLGRLGTELRIALLEGAWWRLVRKSFPMEGGGDDGLWLDYPHDYAYDYTGGAYSTFVETGTLTPCDIRLVIYGPVVNPQIEIGSNVYQVNVNVQAGGYVTVDGREKTITYTLADGTTSNVFKHGVRGSGLNGGNYIFEPIKSGVQDISWTGDFGFDLGWYEEEGEPPWSQS